MSKGQMYDSMYKYWCLTLKYLQENGFVVGKPNASATSRILAGGSHTAAERDTADILHSLLGVEMGSIDQMLDSADSAAMLLGVQH